MSRLTTFKSSYTAINLWFMITPSKSPVITGILGQLSAGYDFNIFPSSNFNCNRIDGLKIDGEAVGKSYQQSLCFTKMQKFP